MLKRATLFAVVMGAFALAVFAAGDKPKADQPKVPAMKFNDVVEVAPGVFFRYSSISATDKDVPFGGTTSGSSSRITSSSSTRTSQRRRAT
jgi:cyclase